MSFKKLVLPLILLLGFVFRISGLSQHPAGFTPDEASFGYDAYSILKTGADQWGHKYPLVLESFGDYKAPLYTYLTIPFVSVFGLTKFAVRLPNALAGTAAIYITYLLAREISRFLEIKDRKLEIASGFLLAVSPWHIMMSRGAFEANLTTFLLPFGILLFLYSLRRKSTAYAILSSFVFGLNLFSYHSAKLVTPLVVLVAAAVYKKDILTNKRRYFWPAFIFSFFMVVTAYTFLIGAGARAADINIFKGSLNAAADLRTKSIITGTNPVIARLLHNRYETGLRIFFGNYLTYFSPQFLFTNGPSEATYGMFPGMGVLNWYSFILIFGFVGWLFKKKKPAIIYLLLAWITVAPIPAALTTGPGYSANRSVIMLPAIQLLLALGLIYLYEQVKIIKNKKVITSLYLAFSLLVIVDLWTFRDNYFRILPQEHAKDMLYGNLQVNYWLAENSGNKKVIIAKELSEPHIFTAFAGKTNPEVFQSATEYWNYKEKGLIWVDQLPEYSLGKYTYKTVHTEEYKDNGNVLLVGRPEAFPEDSNIIYQVNYPNGSPSIYVVSPASNYFAYEK